MGIIILISIVMTIVTIAIGASRKHHNMAVVVLLAVICWPLSLIYVALTPAVVGPRRYLSARDRRALEQVEAAELREKADRLLQAQDNVILARREAEANRRYDAARERKHTEALSRAAERIR